MKPDIKHYRKGDTDYLRELVEKGGLSQRKTAERIGVPERTFRDWLNGDHPSQAPYTVQYALEQLAK